MTKLLGGQRRGVGLGWNSVWCVATAAAVCLLAQCGGNGDADTFVPLSGEVVIDGLVGPTQFLVGPTGEWWVAQLNGGENDGTGQIVVVDPESPDSPPQVVLDGLDKPTGVAIFNDELWVMERNRLTRGPLPIPESSADAVPTDGEERTVVAEDLEFNGRSEGALTVDGDRLLFDTSGAIRGGEVVADSGILWAVDASGAITRVASGFKHAYAQVRDGDGRLFSTEISDGAYDGEAPDDEIVQIEDGQDFGWPRCVGDNRPVSEYGGSTGVCDQVPRSVAVFAPGATPTSIVVAPWDDNLLLVALWNEGRVMGVNATDPVAPQMELFGEAERPQHLVVDDGRIFLSDHAAGAILELTRPAG